MILASHFIARDVYKKRPVPGRLGPLPRSGYTKQPRALALGYASREIRPESGGRGASLGRSRAIPPPRAKHRVPLSGHLLLTTRPRAKALGCSV